MEFRTEIKVASQQENLIDHKSKVLLLGSCFSDHIGSKLSYHQFDALVNPFGTLFNPNAIDRVLKNTVETCTHCSKNIVKQGELYHSLHHPSHLSALRVDQVLDNIHKAQNLCLQQLKTATHVVITLGTSWVYQHQQTKELVASCHKIPQTAFDKKILAIDEVLKALKGIVSSVRKVNSSTQIVFTVSPVRHTKSGLMANSLSKAHLLSAVAHLKNRESVSYFPSYEIMMDDLRDYRFYQSDMIHPNEVAISYIWKQFCKVWITAKSQSYFKSIVAIQQGKMHKPFYQQSVSHQEFLKKLAIQQQQLEEELNIQFDA